MRLELDENFVPPEPKKNYGYRLEKDESFVPPLKKEPTALPQEAVMFGKASGALARDVGEFAKRYVSEPLGGAIGEVGKTAEEFYQRRLEPEYQKAVETPIYDEDTGKVTAPSLRGLGGKIIQSAPGMAVTMAPMGVAARAISAIPKISKGAKTALEMAGGGIGEGVVSGLSSGRQAAEYVRGLSQEEISKATEYRKLIESGHTDSSAREILSKKAYDIAALGSGVSTAALGSLAGPTLSKLMRGEGGRLLTRTAKGAIAEAGTEAPQSAAEQIMQNLAARETVEPTRELTKGAVSAAVEGGVVGGFMGGSLGVAAPSGKKRAAKETTTIAGQPIEPVEKQEIAPAEEKGISVPSKPKVNVLPTPEAITAYESSISMTPSQNVMVFKNKGKDSPRPYLDKVVNAIAARNKTEPDYSQFEIYGNIDGWKIKTPAGIVDTVKPKSVKYQDIFNIVDKTAFKKTSDANKARVILANIEGRSLSQYDLVKTRRDKGVEFYVRRKDGSFYEGGTDMANIPDEKLKIGEQYAVEEGKIPEGGQPEYKDVGEGRPPTETGGGNIPVESRAVEEEKVAPVAPPTIPTAVETPPVSAMPTVEPTERINSITTVEGAELAAEGEIDELLKHIEEGVKSGINPEGMRDGVYVQLTNKYKEAKDRKDAVTMERIAKAWPEVQDRIAEVQAETEKQEEKPKKLRFRHAIEPKILDETNIRAENSNAVNERDARIVAEKTSPIPAVPWLSKEEIAINDIIGKLNLPDIAPIHVLDEPTPKLLEYGVSPTAQGTTLKYPNGDVEIYIFAKNNKSIEQVKTTVFHELVGHVGLAQMMGTSYNRIGRLVREYAKSRPESKRMWDEIVKKYNIDVTIPSEVNIAAEEFMAFLSESDPKSRGLFKRVIAIIRNWLRRAGFDIKITDSDVIELIAKARGAKPLIPFKTASLAGSFNRIEKDDAYNEWVEKGTDSKYFKKWFGKSKVVDKNGFPMEVYHGTARDFDVFAPDAIGSNFPHISEGFFFTNRARMAQDYADNASRTTGNPGRILSVYAKLENPYIIKEDSEGEGVLSLIESRNKSTDEIIKYAKNRGHDGIIAQDLNLIDLETGEPDTVVVAFHPSQIKSVNHHQGYFDSNSLSVFDRRTIEELDQTVKDYTLAAWRAWTSQTPREQETTSRFRQFVSSPEFIKRLEPYVDIFQKRTERFHKRLIDGFKLDNLADANLDEVMRKFYEENPRAAASMQEIADDWNHTAPQGRDLVKKAKKELGLETISNLEEWEMRRELAVKDIRDSLAKQGFKPNEIAEAEKTYRAIRHVMDGYYFDLMMKPLMEIQQKQFTHPELYKQFKVQVANEDGTTSQVDLKKAIAMMGDLRGSYLPLVRTGKYVLSYAIERDGVPVMVREQFDYKTEGEKRRIEIERGGAKNVKFDLVTQTAEEIFADMRTPHTEAMIRDAVENINDPVINTNVSRGALVEAISYTLAEAVKARGARKHKMKRRREKIEGYISNLPEAITRYAVGLSASVAKGESAEAAFRLMSEGDKSKGIDRLKTTDPDYGLVSRYVENQLTNQPQGQLLANGIKSVAVWRYLWANPKSAAINLTTLATMSPAMIHAYAMDGKGSITESFASVMKSIPDYARAYKAIRKGKAPSHLTPEESAFLLEIHETGLDNPQYADEIMQGLRSRLSEKWRWIMDKGMIPFSATERLTRGATLLAAYRMGRKNGLSISVAKEKARISLHRSNGMYGRASQYLWAQESPALQSVLTFSKFGSTVAQSLYEFGVEKKDYKALLWGMAAPVVIGGAKAMPFYGIVMPLLGWMIATATGDERDKEKQMFAWFASQLGVPAETLARYGLVGTFGQVNIAGSMGAGIGPVRMSDSEGLLPKDVIGWFAIPGAILGDAAKAWDSLQRGDIWRAATEVPVVPASIASIAKSGMNYTRGITTQGYRPILDDKGKPLVPSGSETVMAALSFQPVRWSTAREHKREISREVQSFNEKKKDLLEEYRMIMLSTKGEERQREMAAWRERKQEFNRQANLTKNKDIRPISYESLERQLKALRGG